MFSKLIFFLIVNFLVLSSCSIIGYKTKMESESNNWEQVSDYNPDSRLGDYTTWHQLKNKQIDCRLVCSEISRRSWFLGLFYTPIPIIPTFGYNMTTGSDSLFKVNLFIYCDNDSSYSLEIKNIEYFFNNTKISPDSMLLSDPINNIFNKKSGMPIFVNKNKKLEKFVRFEIKSFFKFQKQLLDSLTIKFIDTKINGRKDTIPEIIFESKTCFWWIPSLSH